MFIVDRPGRVGKQTIWTIFSFIIRYKYRHLKYFTSFQYYESKSIMFFTKYELVLTAGLKSNHFTPEYWADSLIACNWAKPVYFSCSLGHKEDESVTEWDAWEDGTWATLPLQRRVGGRGAASIQQQRGPWYGAPGAEGLSGLLGLLCAGHRPESGHRPDQRRGGQHRVWRHPHPCSCYGHIWLPLPLHGNSLLWKWVFI